MCGNGEQMENDEYYWENYGTDDYYRWLAFRTRANHIQKILTK